VAVAPGGAYISEDPLARRRRGRWRKTVMALQITQKSGEGLSRVYGVTVPIQDLLDKLEAKITEIRPQMNIKGFRPGKVPAAHVKRMYGKSLMGEIVQQAINDSQQQALDEAKVRVATSPDLQLEGDIESVLAGKSDLTFDLSVQVMPEFEPTDISAIELKRPVYEITDEEVDEQLKTISEQNRAYEKKAGGKKAKAEDGDMLLVDFVGRIDGEVFEGGSAEDSEIVIGAGRFIPGFEEQLKGAKQDQTVTVKVSFPEDYGAEQLAGKAAEFEVTVKEVRAPKDETAIDEDFAKRIGFDTVEALKEAIRNQVGQQYAAASRFKAKRALLDVLDEKHDFDLPQGMVESEFAAIWQQVEAERASGELSDEDKEKTEEQLRAEYRKIAERRVRLGLVLAEIGQRNNVQVSEQEMQQALINEIRRYPREQQQQAFEFFRSNPQASAQLRAPIYEEKVVDLILEKAKVEDTPVSKEELFKEDELPEGYGE
jgi:trigger factor